MKYILISILILSIYLNVSYQTTPTTSTQFTSYLWKLDLVGVPADINFLNLSEVLTVTNNGVVAKINVKNGMVIWKKIYKTNIKIVTDDTCKLTLLIIYLFTL